MTAFYNKKLETTPDSVKSDDFSFYGDSILKGQKNLLSYYFKKYISDTCVIQVYKRDVVKNDFEGYEVLGDINNNKTPDSVFVLMPLSWCDYEAGQSYYFTDTSLPRLASDSYCCHPQNVFKIADIDEDGICEIGVYYSTCASRYKSIKIYSLKNKGWRQIASSDFDILTQDPTKVKFKELVQKISKDKFKIKNFLEGKQYWDTVRIH